ncbi:hypothetical protein A9Z64_03150 [Moraxella osloensis]|uniref:Uncharacterized protein conserved in bacteria n=1 Tax=Faucicola osloensis TaxID=34062 RepID=A0A378QA78_FAUOS|nr:DUF2059 domain-containing protein [Moraxella osloensis]AME02133.1 hypothetical protein AXE82_10520 [Moraxella osloensis]OBX51209.1 hypothetical protein A9Z64_03150 [Moraxella osloensis]QPT42120.1 DUF2059 domain-containing protein [Moraxella osloensis]STY97743.1 Uncharacterized protein conserved in bacteria [Moraxella osloensis]
MRHQYSSKKPNKPLNPSGSLNAKKLALLILLTSTGMTMLVHPAYAELIIQNNPVNGQTPVTTINELQTQPTDASLDKLIKVLHIDKMIDEMLAQRQQAANMTKGLPQELPTDENAGIFSRHAQKQLKNIFVKYSTVLGQQLDQPIAKQQLQQAYQAIAKRTYTQAEVDALNQFYETPMGQRILSKQSQVSSEFVQVMMPTLIGDTSQFEKAMPSLQKDIEKIFK